MAEAGDLVEEVSKKYQITDLQQSIESGNPELAIEIIQSATVPNLNFILFKTKETCLHLAARQGMLEVCLKLMLAGANREMRDINGNTALLTALDFKNFDIAATMLNQAFSIDVNVQNNSEQTALHKAVTYCQEVLVKKLIMFGASTQLKNNEGQIPRDCLKQTGSFLTTDADTQTRSRIKTILEIAESLTKKTQGIVSVTDRETLLEKW